MLTAAKPRLYCKDFLMREIRPIFFFVHFYDLSQAIFALYKIYKV